MGVKAGGYTGVRGGKSGPGHNDGERSRRLGRARYVVVHATVLAMLLAACGPSSETESDADGASGAETIDPAGTSEGRIEQSGHLVVAQEGLGQELWATHMAETFAEPITSLWGDTLLRANPETRALEPGLAESWEASDDGLTWTFRLRPNIPFHDDWGTLTAEDVKFTWGLWLRDETLRARGGIYRAAVDNDIDNFEILNDLEFRLHASEPTPTLLDQLHQGVAGLAVHSKAHYDAVGEEEAFRRPIGTGPFRFIDHQPGLSVTLEALPEHWRQTSEFATLEVRLVEEEAARLAQVRAGEIDMAPISLTTVPEAEAAGVRVISVRDTALSNIRFGGMYPGDDDAFDRDAPYIQADEPEKGLAIRQAMSHAIDRQAIVDSVLLGTANPAVGPGLSFMPGHHFTDPTWEVHPYDPELARQLLADGGYPDGFEVTLVMYEQSGRPGVVDIAEAVSAMWEQIGITVNRMPVDYSAFGHRLEDRTSAGYIFQHAQNYSDDPSHGFFCCMNRDGGLAHFYHPAIDEALPRLTLSASREERIAIAQEVANAIYEDAWQLGIAALSQPYAVSDRIGDWQFTAGQGSYTNLETVTRVR